MSKFVYLTLAALASALLGFVAAPATAFPTLAPPALGTGLTVPVKHHVNGNYGGFNRWPQYNYGHYHNDFNRYYVRRYYGNRCFGWNGYYCGGPYYGGFYGRPYYGGFYGGPFLGFGFGTGYYYAPSRYGYSSRHVAWCKNRYKSYNPRRNTWVANSGKVRQCKSPYWP